MCSYDYLQECVLKHLDFPRAGGQEGRIYPSHIAPNFMQGSCVSQVYVHKLTLDPLLVRVCGRTRVNFC